MAEARPGPPPWPLGRAGRQRARTHARRQARTLARVPLASRQPGHVGRAREAAREQPAGCVNGRSRVVCAAREPAPPAQRSPPACPPARRRGGVWVSNAALPLWAAPGSVPPAASRPGGGCSCTRRGTDASSRGEGCCGFFVFWIFCFVFWSVGDVSQGPKEDISNGERVLGARSRPWPWAAGALRGRYGARARACRTASKPIPAAGQALRPGAEASVRLCELGSRRPRQASRL